VLTADFPATCLSLCPLHSYTLVKRMGVSGSGIAFAQNQRQRGMLLVGAQDGAVRVYHTGRC
jgi:hypothetical protein